jgi:hypothetical protein
MSDGIQVSTPGCLTFFLCLFYIFLNSQSVKALSHQAQNSGEMEGRKNLVVTSTNRGLCDNRCRASCGAPQFDHRDLVYALDHKIVPAPVMGIRGEATVNSGVLQTPLRPTLSVR